MAGAALCLHFARTGRLADRADALPVARVVMLKGQVMHAAWEVRASGGNLALPYDPVAQLLAFVAPLEL